MCISGPETILDQADLLAKYLLLLQAASFQVRNQLWDGRTQEQFYDAMQWLYGWGLDNCMKH